MQESPHEREGIDNKHFRVLTGLVGLVALLFVVGFELQMVLPIILEVGVQSLTSIQLIFVVTSPAGWVGLVYACWIRSGRITDTALAFVWALGICGMTITYIAIADPFYLPATVCLTGMWILNGLGIVWIVQKVRRIRAASNTDEVGECAAVAQPATVRREREH